MFTGIIKDIGIVEEISKKNGILNLTIKSKLSKKFKIDESVCHNGVCLTVVGRTQNSHRVQIIPETLSKTNFDLLKVGSIINLEPSLSLQSLVSGHLVQGHIDCTCLLEKIKKKNGSMDFVIKISKKYKKYCIPQGSVCINGVSLTIAEMTEKSIKVSIIPYTYKNTNFHILSEGDYVNVEFDLIGKYVLGLKN